MEPLRRRVRPSLPIVVALAVTLATLGGWTLLTWRQARVQVSEAAAESALRLAQAVARDQDRLIEATMTLLIGVGQRPEVIAGDAVRCRVSFAETLKASRAYLELMAATPAGEVFCAARGTTAAAAALLDASDVRRSIDSGNLTLGPLTIDRATRRGTVTLTAPAVDDSGAVRAVVAAALDLGWLGRALVETPLAEGASLTVLDRAGVVLAHYPDGERWVGEVLEHGGAGIVSRGVDLDGRAAIVATTPLLRDAERAGDATVVVALPQATVYREANRPFVVHVVGLGVVALLLAITAALGVEHLVAGPARALARVVHRIGRGDVRARAGNIRQHRALGELARTVDALASDLQQRRHVSPPLAPPLAPALRPPPAGPAPGIPVPELPAPVVARRPPVAPHEPPAAVSARGPAVARVDGDVATPETYWGFREAPFGNSPNPAFLYPSPGHEDALLRLTYAVRQRRGCVMLTGDPGCGKTTLIRTMMRDLHPDRFEIALVAQPVQDAGELLGEVLYELGVETAERQRPRLLHLLNDILARNYRTGRDTILIVDDAQVVDDQAWFEEIALLLNFQTNERALLTIVLVGTPDVTERVARVRLLDARVGARCHLVALDAVHTAKYVVHRLARAGRAAGVFTTDALQAIHELTGGTPRAINNLCDTALWMGTDAKVTEIDETFLRRVAAGGRPVVEVTPSGPRPIRLTRGPA